MARGFAQADAALARVPADARAKASELLIEFGLETSAAQKAVVAKDSGHLAAGLEWESLVDELRVRPMAPREFIVLPGIEERLGRRSAQFWSEVLPA